MERSSYKEKPMKDFHPVYYMSSKKSMPKRNSYEFKIMAIIKAIKKFRIYLLGIKFKIITNCQTFQKTLSKENLPPKVARWALMLEFEYEIEHRIGKCIKYIDTLSRFPVMIIEDTMLALIKNEQDKEER